MGAILIFLGIVFNKYVLENTIVRDAQINSQTSILLILAAQIVLVALGLFLLIRKPNIRITITKDSAFVIGSIGIVISILLMPPIFSVTLAMSDLLTNEITGLWVFFGLCFMLSLFTLFYRGKGRNEITSLYFGVLMLILIELSARFFVVAFAPGLKPRLARLGNRTYMEFSSSRGHPFFQYTNNPKYVPSSDVSRAVGVPINSYGFIGPEYTYEKPSNVIRIACLGGSTTAKGYPKMMEDHLNDWNDDGVHRFEVMNFGIGGYTTAHSAVNFILNVVDFAPDYVVIHHAWNERAVRNYEKGFRSDYSHALKYFHEPVIFDRYPIRVSIVYRYLKDALSFEPPWIFIETAIFKRTPQEMVAAAKKYSWKNLDELKPYRRNIKTIMDFANLRGIKPVLTTQPHTTNPQADHFYIAQHIDQCNAILRDLRVEYADRILFCDVDSLITGKMDEEFLDVGHLSPKGDSYKAEQIGRVIFED